MKALNPRGERHFNAKLTEKKVKEIRKKYSTTNYSMMGLADEYGVSFYAIYSVIHRKTWRHVK